MKEREKTMRNSKKIKRIYAGSLSDRICFFLDDTRGIEAIETDSGCSIKLCNINEKESIDIKSFLVARENKKLFIKTIFLVISAVIAWIYLTYILLTYVTNNVFKVLLLFIFFLLIIQIIVIVMLEKETIDYSLKSKHAAEHKMANFIKYNKRLPKNMEEIKRTSRFSLYCGSRASFYRIVEDFIKNMFVIIITIATKNWVQYMCGYIIVYPIIYLVYFLIIRVIFDKKIEENHVYKNIVEATSILLGYILQCVNTTSKVEDKDIFLAYSVAKIWMQIVYPEYYNPNDEFPIPDNFKVNSN